MRFLVFCASVLLTLPSGARAAEVKTVLIFAVDGLGANVLRANTPPHFAAFIRNGSYSLHARGVMPTVTFPNFASMISGAGPEQHGVTVTIGSLTNSPSLRSAPAGMAISPLSLDS